MHSRRRDDGLQPHEYVSQVGEDSQSAAAVIHDERDTIHAIMRSGDGLDRHCAVVTLGGGVVGDLGGFAAATFLRGIPFAQVPTTVLAMVDASIGGKTGVNLEQGKNLVGAFHQPSGVYIDTRTLASLPRRQRAAGAAELIKAAAIWDEDLFEWLLERMPQPSRPAKPRKVTSNTPSIS